MSVEPLNALVGAFVRYKPKGIVEGFEKYVAERMTPYEHISLYDARGYDEVYSDWLRDYVDQNPELVEGQTGYTAVVEDGSVTGWRFGDREVRNEELVTILTEDKNLQMMEEFRENFNDYGTRPSTDILWYEGLYDDAMTVWLNGLMVEDPKFFEEIVRQCFPEGAM